MELQTCTGELLSPVYLFAEPLSLDRDSFVGAMLLQDTDGTDAALTCPAVDLDRWTDRSISLHLH